MYDLDWDVVLRNRDAFLGGLALALMLAFFGLSFGSLIGLLLAFARTSRRRFWRALATGYVETIRNVPLLLLLFVLYFGLPIFALRTFPRDVAELFILEGNRAAVVALAIYAGGYLAEIFRAGLLSVGRPYKDAARSLGLRETGVTRYVSLPIMMRVSLPALSNTFIALFKDTSLASSIAVQELTFAARELSTNTFRVIEAWATAGALYLLTSYLLAFALRALERRIRWSI